MKPMPIKAALFFLVSLFVSLAAAVYAEDAAAPAQTPEEQAVALVEKAVLLIQEKGEAALAAIGDPDGAFYNKDTALYAFVYDDAVVIRAHPFKPTLVGRSYKGKPDVRGKMFRDEIVEKALAEGGGWTEYSYQKPEESGVHRKKVFGKLVLSGEQKYIVCAGIYSD